jgi:transcriptional regulator with XRE-family HTH domain
MQTLQQIAELLKAQLKTGQLTQEALRSEAGISRQTLTNVLSGHQDYKLTTLLAVSDRLGLELALVPKNLGDSFQSAPSTPVIKSVVQAALDRIGTIGKEEGE